MVTGQPGSMRIAAVDDPFAGVDFSYLERFRIHNGIMFFKVYRPILRRRLAKAEALSRRGQAPVFDDRPDGTFRMVKLQGKSAD